MSAVRTSYGEKIIRLGDLLAEARDAYEAERRRFARSRRTFEAARERVALIEADLAEELHRISPALRDPWERKNA